MTRRVDTPGLAPLRSWGDELRHRRRLRRRLLAKTALTALGILILAPTIVRLPAPRLVWNASASAPIGLYSVMPGAAIQVGDMVVAWPPATIRQLAADRHYLPRDVPLVKQIVAGPGDVVCASGERIFVNGLWLVSRRTADAKGRRLPWWNGCHILHDRQYFLIMPAVPASFDGRYFGLTDATDVIGRARLLWAR